MRSSGLGSSVVADIRREYRRNSVTAQTTTSAFRSMTASRPSKMAGYLTTRLVKRSWANDSCRWPFYFEIGLGAGETGRRPGSHWGGRKPPIPRPSGYPAGTLGRHGSQSQTWD
jgi:hypothetical protein